MLRSLWNLIGLRRQLIKIIADRARDLFLCSGAFLVFAGPAIVANLRSSFS